MSYNTILETRCTVMPSDKVFIDHYEEEDQLFITIDGSNGDNAAFLSTEDAEVLRDELNKLFPVLAKKTKFPAGFRRRPAYHSLTDQQRTVYNHMRKAGSISAREAMDDYGITSATLARRICDLEEQGYEIERERKTHPITDRLYTRYSLVA